MKRIGIFFGVTGGLGKELFALCHGECDEWWLVGRSEERMRAVGNGACRYFDWDLSVGGALARALNEEMPAVAWVVHAAGTGFYGAVENDLAAHEEVDVNVASVVDGVRLVLPFLTAGSRVLLFGSGSAFLPQPYFAVYAASKAFVLSFARALRTELKKRNIRVSVACPGPTDTPFLTRAASLGTPMAEFKKKFISKPDKVARSIYRQARRGKAVICPTWDMRLVHFISKFVH